MGSTKTDKTAYSFHDRQQGNKYCITIHLTKKRRSYKSPLVKGANKGEAVRLQPPKPPKTEILKTQIL
jgi:hypothetical protein